MFPSKISYVRANVRGNEFCGLIFFDKEGSVVPNPKLRPSLLDSCTVIALDFKPSSAFLTL